MSECIRIGEGLAVCSLVMVMDVCLGVDTINFAIGWLACAALREAMWPRRDAA